MQLLLTEAALKRVGDRLRALAPDLDIVTLAPDGTLSRDAAEVDPELYWLSLDAFGAGLGHFFKHIGQGSRGQWVQTFNAGLDNPVFRILFEKGLRVSKSSAQAPPIAEYVVAHGISLLHPIAAQQAAQDAREWKRVPFTEIGSSHWLLVGFGNIGHEIARRVKGFGAQITAVRRSAQPDPLVDRMATQAELPDLLPQADVVVLACALTDETRDIANAAFFAAMKPGAILINIGRGELVDEDALRVGLEAGRPGFAVLDVFRAEPLPAGSWPWTHPNVRVTAHASNAGNGTLRRGDELFLENLRRFRAGEPLLNEASKAEVGL
ncbi:phosphoglycerate dehydrogenase-like enzyme [Caulobacter ginsengisoli]|uniref:Phosphoglycerate dehydrogenase-like enzyme n=1 Tax=Caulobacter ginsengisoli TaxID=400775 RepID=A0ABU0IMM8_9CAUL|nr:D-2-hydroxyacid dehydrogenase [Caulobacter ginsengisoli]MDQ0463219.1 phosphoglycerate dehydrogenase-like enzyme [Caulobacter ginsengisoli]